MYWLRIIISAIHCCTGCVWMKWLIPILWIHFAIFWIVMLKIFLRTIRMKYQKYFRKHYRKYKKNIIKKPYKLLYKTQIKNYNTSKRIPYAIHRWKNSRHNKINSRGIAERLAFPGVFYIFLLISVKNQVKKYKTNTQ